MQVVRLFFAICLQHTSTDWGMVLLVSFLVDSLPTMSMGVSLEVPTTTGGVCWKGCENCSACSHISCSGSKMVISSSLSENCLSGCSNSFALLFCSSDPRYPCVSSNGSTNALQVQPATARLKSLKASCLIQITCASMLRASSRALVD